MRILLAGFVAVAFTSLASGQDRDRVFYLTHTDTIQQFQEVATVIRTIADIKPISADNEQRSISVRATPAQIAMAEWLFNELDNPAPQPSVPHEYRVPGSDDDVVRVFYLPDTPTIQDFQEAATVVRTIADFRRAFTYNERRAFVVRGTGSQIGLAEWLVKQLEPNTSPSSAEYRVVPGDQPHDENVVRVMYLTHTGSIQNFQKAAAQIRSATNINRIFLYNHAWAVALRGTADQIALAERLAMNLDKP